MSFAVESVVNLPSGFWRKDTVNLNRPPYEATCRDNTVRLAVHVRNTFRCICRHFTLTIWRALAKLVNSSVDPDSSKTVLGSSWELDTLGFEVS